jgi:hypothetical protein
MKLISPSNKEVDIGDTLRPEEYIGMTRREILDTFLRDRAIALGVTALNGLVTEITVPESNDGRWSAKERASLAVITYSSALTTIAFPASAIGF